MKKKPIRKLIYIKAEDLDTIAWARKQRESFSELVAVALRGLRTSRIRRKLNMAQERIKDANNTSK